MMFVRVLKSAWSFLPSLGRIFPELAAATAALVGFWMFTEMRDAREEAEEAREAVERQDELHAAELEALRADVRAAEAWRQSFERLELRLGEVEEQPLSPAFSAYKEFVIMEQGK